MGECIEREATIKRIKEVYCAGCNSYNGVRCRACGTGDAIDIIEDAPTVDAVVVTRCKDCKHIRPEVDAYTGETVGYWCYLIDFSGVDVDDFCSYGERKENNDEKV